jgi:hypothetical protein
VITVLLAGRAQRAACTDSGHDARLDPLDALGGINDPSGFGCRHDDRAVSVGAHQVTRPDLDPGHGDRLIDGDQPDPILSTPTSGLRGGDEGAALGVERRPA